MVDRVADDFAGIAARMKELSGETHQRAGRWWCNTCGDSVEGECVTYEETHDPRYGGCGSPVIPFCETCEGGGWTMTSMHPGPIFRLCESCGNPQDNECP